MLTKPIKPEVFQVQKTRLIEVPTVIVMDLATVLEDFDQIMNGFDPIEILDMILTHVLSDSPRDSFRQFQRDMMGFCWFHDLEVTQSHLIMNYLETLFDYINDNVPVVWTASMRMVGYHVTQISSIKTVTIEAGANYEHYLTEVGQLTYEPH